jgi:hypothetical protein
MKVGLWAGAALILLMFEHAYGTQWRGSSELNYQNFPGGSGRDELWRQFVDFSAEDRLFVKNSMRFSLRLENRSFGGRQPHELRPRFGLELAGMGYAFQGYYAPFKRARYDLPDNSEHRYNAALSVFPRAFPRFALSYDALSSQRAESQRELQRTYTLTADYSRHGWRGQFNLLRHDRESETRGWLENLKTVFLGNNFERNFKRVNAAMSHQFSYSDRRQISGVRQFAAAHSMTAQFGASPMASTQLSGDYSGRISNTSQDGVHRATDDHTASARASFRPFTFAEAALLRYYSSTEQTEETDAEVDFVQARLSLNGRLFRSLSGALSMFRTWYVKSPSEADVSDALYIQSGGNIFPHVRLSFEFSYSDLHTGAEPVAVVRAVSLRMTPVYRSEWQIDYSSQGVSARTDLADVDRQNVNVTVQQSITGRVYFSVGTGFSQDRLVSMDWRQRWLVSGGMGIRRWMLISGNYNRLSSIAIIPGQPPAENTPTRTDLQITMYPEARWVVTANVFQDRPRTGVASTSWGGAVRYQF